MDAAQWGLNRQLEQGCFWLFFSCANAQVKRAGKCFFVGTDVGLPLFSTVHFCCWSLVML